MTSPPNELLDERADPHARSVLEDWAIERGFAIAKLGVVIQFAYAGADDADDAADDDVDADDAADDADDDAADDDAGFDDAADDAYAAAYDAADDDVDAADDADASYNTAHAEWAAVRAWSQILCGELE